MTARRRAITKAKPAPPATPPLARVEILWSENPAIDALPVKVFRSLAHADANLARALDDEPAPNDGSYHKTSFQVVWSDGRRVTARADLTRDDTHHHATRGGLLRAHLLDLGRWLRDKSGAPPWSRAYSADEIARNIEWGHELLRRLEAEPRYEATRDDDLDPGEPEDSDDEPRNAGPRYRGPTLRPWPPRRLDWLQERFGRRPHLRRRSNPLDRDSSPRTTNADVRWVANYITRALDHDLDQYSPDTAARVRAYWSAVLTVVAGRATGAPDDEYPDNDTFWDEHLHHLSRLLVTGEYVGLRNRGRARLTFRSVGATAEPYPAWVQALRGRSGVYVIRERQDDDSAPIVYVGQSSQDRLYETLTRHFQAWRRWKGFWRGQYAEGHDPGLSYDRAVCEAAVLVTNPADAMAREAELIARLRPRDNLLGQPADEADPVPF